MDSAWLILSSLFSLIGMAVCLYGRKQRLIAPTLVGIALMVYPYFVSDTLAMIGIGVALLVALVMGTRMETEL